MAFKVFIFALLAVGVFAEYQITEEQRNQVKQVIADTCKRNGAEGKVDEITTTVHTFIDCVKGLFNLETIKKEIEEAKPNGALDEVFKKYCAKSPELKTCISTLIDGVSPCLDSSIRENIGTGKNATSQLIDFVCHKDGDRIALFIAEEGPQCFQEKTSAIRGCAEKAKEGITGVEAVKKLTIDEQCAKFDSLTSCIVKALEECTSPTPGNMAESLFRYMKNGSPCKVQFRDLKGTFCFGREG
ncbi:27 kDa hemolymph protein-like isoform X1 [Pieris napi]|uniref:27 kDa hemolymph protein-like isoform X1 n=1 Tax=Pieris napi TaxID=78633 RepID=UPI001FBA20DF|nr:27 kDa hemolymph protein-like isoform X1 [Pieris napi]